MDESRKQFYEAFEVLTGWEVNDYPNRDVVRLCHQMWEMSRAAVETYSTHEKVIGSFNTENNELALFDKNISVEKFAHWHVHNKFEVVIRPNRAAGIKVKE